MAMSISPMGVSKPKSVPRPGGVSSVGKTDAVPSPRGIPKKNTRDYGKPMAAPPSPPADPFGVTAGTSRIGGL